MLKQKTEQRLIEWKNTHNKKPLIIKGCRQCGKTFSVLDFANKNYKKVVCLNFFKDPDHTSVFSGFPLGVKAATGNTKSTKTILRHPEKYHVHHVIKLGNYNVGRNDKILTLPLCMAFLLTNI